MGKFADELLPKFADAEAEPTLADFKEHSIAYAIQWRIEEARKPGARRIGESASYGLPRLQRTVIGGKGIPKLTAQDFVDHCRARIASGVKPATVLQDWSALRSTIRDYVETNELPLEWLMVLSKARRKLEKEQLISKGIPRDRLPTLEELGLFRGLYEQQNKHPRCVTNMVRVLDGLVLLGRRVSELARIERQHINVEKKTYWVYDLKNSKGKGYHGQAALIEGAWELVESILAEIPNVPTARLFPVNSKTCSQRQTLAKKKLQKEHPHLFQNLRMHDQRAYCFTELLKKGYTVTQVRKGVSLHKTNKMLDDVYARINAEDLHQGPLGQRIESRA